MSRAQEITALRRQVQDLEQKLTAAQSDLGAVIGVALAAMEDPDAAVSQLQMLADRAHRFALPADVAPHWRLADALLALKTSTTIPGPAPDATDGGA